MKYPLTFLLFLLLSITTFAQKTDSTCLYRIKFFTWQWEYWQYSFKNDTDSVGTITGIIPSTDYMAKEVAHIKMTTPLLNTFLSYPEKLIVTNCDGTKEYKVTSFEISADSGEDVVSISAKTYSNTIDANTLSRIWNQYKKGRITIDKITLGDADEETGRKIIYPDCELWNTSDKKTTTFNTVQVDTVAQTQPGLLENLRQLNDSTCLYHLKFYNWKWEYWSYQKGDSIQQHDANNKPVGPRFPAFAFLEAKPLSLPKWNSPLPDSFFKYPQKITVTSCNETKEYEIDHIEFMGSRKHSTFSFQVNGNTTDAEISKQIKSCYKKGYLTIGTIYLKNNNDNVFLQQLLWDNEKSQGEFVDHPDGIFYKEGPEPKLKVKKHPVLNLVIDSIVIGNNKSKVNIQYHHKIGTETGYLKLNDTIAINIAYVTIKMNGENTALYTCGLYKKQAGGKWTDVTTPLFYKMEPGSYSKGWQGIGLSGQPDAILYNMYLKFE